jgi:hypothetical protein
MQGNKENVGLAANKLGKGQGEAVVGKEGQMAITPEELEKKASTDRAWRSLFPCQIC